MNITIDKESSRLYIAAEEVARFARTKKSAPLRIPFCEREGEYSDDADIRRELSFTYTKGNISFTVTGLCDLVWQAGDDYLCDPPHEPQGWYSVFDNDTTTIETIKKYSKEINK